MFAFDTYLMSSIENTLKKVLKPPRTRSRTPNTTEECPEATVNLAPVEAAEPVTELASKESRDAYSSESISFLYLNKCSATRSIKDCVNYFI